MVHQLRFSESNNLRIIGRLIELGFNDIKTKGIVQESIIENLSFNIDKLRGAELDEFLKYNDDFITIITH